MTVNEGLRARVVLKRQMSGAVVIGERKRWETPQWFPGFALEPGTLRNASFSVGLKIQLGDSGSLKTPHHAVQG
jgi:hypothetical protein